jgi:hypothetical protein
MCSRKVLDDIDNQAARLALSMQLPSGSRDRVRKVIRDAALTNWDRHLIFGEIEDVLDFTAGETVGKAFLAIWAQTSPGEVDELLAHGAGSRQIA